jgi:hypothetical protein
LRDSQIIPPTPIVEPELGLAVRELGEAKSGVGVRVRLPLMIPFMRG